MRTGSSTTWGAWTKFWNQSNDGSGSGLDADTVDGLHASSFAASSAISGTANYVPKFTGANSVGNSQIVDDGTNVAVGTAVSSYKLGINGTL